MHIKIAIDCCLTSKRWPLFPTTRRLVSPGLVFAEADQKARVWLKSQCRDAGLAVREDAGREYVCPLDGRPA